MTRKKIEIYTDGACRGNPGAGGWGALLIYGKATKEIKGFEIDTTNNRMELTAVIMALREIKHLCHIRLFTDSKYIYNAVTSWLPQWKLNGWRTANKGLVKNKDLWKALDVLITKHDIDWQWVKAHSGHLHNERADQLANEAIDNMLQNHPAIGR